MLDKKPVSDKRDAEAAPHYHGHRERLRERFRAAGTDALSDSSSWSCCSSARTRGATSSR